jgi:hypothetical protein
VGRRDPTKRDTTGMDLEAGTSTCTPESGARRGPSKLCGLPSRISRG